MVPFLPDLFASTVVAGRILVFDGKIGLSPRSHRVLGFLNCCRVCTGMGIRGSVLMGFASRFQLFWFVSSIEMRRP